VLSLAAPTRIFLCREPVDFRKAHDGLTAIIRDQLGEDIFAGGVFVFLNKRRDRIKLFEWDRNGLWLHYKRLEKWTFKWTPVGTSNTVVMSRAELSMLLEGIDLKAGKFRPHFTEGATSPKEYLSMGVKMKDKRAELPRDIEALMTMVIARDEALAARDKALSTRDEKIASLEHNLAVYARMIFGSSSEKRKLTGLASGHPHQLHLFLADLVADADRVAEETGATGKVEVERPAARKAAAKKKGRRGRFPEHLPVVTSTFELPDEQLMCDCGSRLHRMGFEESTELERIEITIVHKKKYAKYACRSCEAGVVTAPAPPRVIDKGLLSAGFLAHVMAERFQFHMPYYRLEKKFASEGLDLSRSVLERSVARCGELLEPLHAALREQVLATDIVFTDDTTVKVAQAGKPGGSKLGRFWIYTDKAGRHFYDFTGSRERDGPATILADFKGFLQADAYPGYDWLFLSGEVTEVACWAHARRKFENAERSDPELAQRALEMIGRLYVVETVARERELDPEGVAGLRRKHSVAILEEIHSWLAVAEAQVLPKSPMGKAVHYALAQWKALNVYVTDGRLEIDNNRSERAMKPLAVGRKNWLFVQNEAGGRTAAIVMSLVKTAEAAGVNVKLYLRDVLRRIASETDVKKLLPHGWKEHFEAEVLGRRHAIIDLLVADQRGE